MEIVKTVLIILVVLVVLYLILTVFFKASTSLTTMQEGDVSQTIDASTLPNNNNTSNYTYSMWFYVQDWNYRFGEEKVLLERKDEDGYSSPGIVLEQ